MGLDERLAMYALRGGHIAKVSICYRIKMLVTMDKLDGWYSAKQQCFLQAVISWITIYPLCCSFMLTCLNVLRVGSHMVSAFNLSEPFSLIEIRNIERSCACGLHSTAHAHTVPCWNRGAVCNVAMLLYSEKLYHFAHVRMSYLHALGYRFVNIRVWWI